MPIPTGDRPFDRLVAELVADQCTANPILGSVLGLTEYDESLPDLSPGLRSRVLAAALEAQDRRAQGRRVLASALGLFAMLAGVAWLKAHQPSKYFVASAPSSGQSSTAMPISLTCMIDFQSMLAEPR